MREKRIFVMAGNYRQFKEWVRDNVIFVHDPSQLMGVDTNDTILIQIGTWFENADSDVIKEEYNFRSLKSK